MYEVRNYISTYLQQAAVETIREAHSVYRYHGHLREVDLPLLTVVVMSPTTVAAMKHTLALH